MYNKRWARSSRKPLDSSFRLEVRHDISLSLILQDRSALYLNLYLDYFKYLHDLSGRFPSNRFERKISPRIFLIFVPRSKHARSLSIFLHGDVAFVCPRVFLRKRFEKYRSRGKEEQKAKEMKRRELEGVTHSREKTREIIESFGTGQCFERTTLIEIVVCSSHRFFLFFLSLLIDIDYLE